MVASSLLHASWLGGEGGGFSQTPPPAVLLGSFGYYAPSPEVKALL